MTAKPYILFWVEVRGGVPASNQWQEATFHGELEKALEWAARQTRGESESTRFVLAQEDDWGGVEKVVMVVDETGIVLPLGDALPKECM